MEGGRRGMEERSISKCSDVSLHSSGYLPSILVVYFDTNVWMKSEVRGEVLKIF